MKQFRKVHLSLFTILACSLILLCGCSSSYEVRSPAGQGDYTYEEMNKELKGRHADIEIEGEKKVSAKEINIAGDSVAWIDTRTDKASTVNISRLRKIVTKSHFIGGLEGLGFGVVGGGGIGLVVGMSTKSSGEIPVGLIYFIAVGGVGTIAGLTTGMIIGHSYNYEFPATEQSDSLQNGKAPHK